MLESSTLPILQVQDLRVQFKTLGGIVSAVDGMNFSLKRGQCLGIIGESGCGKSVTARSILRLVMSGKTDGKILYTPKSGNTIDLVQINPKGKDIQAIRGKDIAMIFQEPMTSLTPVYTVGEQIVEAIRRHTSLTKAESVERAIEVLQLVGLPDSVRRINDYPHQMSGGMRQRAMIAMALACNPQILIADEPTTALDVTVQAQILRLLDRLRREMDMSLIIITHDMGVVAKMADEIIVMYLGQMVEQAPVTKFFAGPAHPYSQGLLNSMVLPHTVPKEPLSSISGSVPNPLNIPTGCRFRNRCPAVHERCSTPPPVVLLDNNQTVACWLYEKDSADG